MNIIVFGASGSVGLEIVKQGIEKDFKITAFVRHPEHFPFTENKNLKIYKGDILNMQDIKDALKNQDVVLCTIGDGKIGKIRAIGTKNILDAMQMLNLNRLICQSTIGAGDSYQNLNFVWKYIMFGFLLKNVLPDHNLQEKNIEQSEINYTILRPSALTNGPITNQYIIDFGKDKKKLSLKINRADVADFILKQIHDTRYYRKTVNISN